MSRSVAEKEQAYADIGIEDGVIRVQQDLPPALAAEKLLHEILHGVWDVWDLPEKHEERVVTALAKGLSTVMQDNPAVLTWLRRRWRAGVSGQGSVG